MYLKKYVMPRWTLHLESVIVLKNINLGKTIIAELFLYGTQILDYFACTY
jgi:hypothetical protein